MENKYNLGLRCRKVKPKVCLQEYANCRKNVTLSTPSISCGRFLAEALNNLACREFFDVVFKVLSGF